MTSSKEYLESILEQLSELDDITYCKTMEERIFYMNMCIRDHLSKRELERQIDSGYVYEGRESLVNRIERRNELHTLENTETNGLGSRMYNLIDIGK